MPLLARQRKISREEYLANEQPGKTRHEYLDGIVYALDEMSAKHRCILQNVVSLLQKQMSAQDYCIFQESMKLRIVLGTAEVFYYPDILIAPVPSQEQKEYWEQAKVVIEVVSPSTPTVDRREKLLMYRQLVSFEEYVLVAQDDPGVTIYRRAESWQEKFVGGNEILHLTSLKAELAVQQIYAESSSKIRLQ